MNLLSLLLGAFNLLGDIGNIFSIKTIALFGGIGVVLQAVQTIAHALHFVANIITYFNHGVLPTWLVPALGVIDGMNIAANLLNTLWMGSGWLLGVQGLLTGLASPEISTLALGATVLALVGQLGAGIVQGFIDSSMAFESGVLNTWTTQQREQYCVQQEGAANC